MVLFSSPRIKMAILCILTHDVQGVNQRELRPSVHLAGKVTLRLLLQGGCCGCYVERGRGVD